MLKTQASGVPVVVSNSGALPEVAGKGAVFVNPESVESIKQGLAKVLEKSVFRQKLVKKVMKML